MRGIVLEHLTTIGDRLPGHAPKAPTLFIKKNVS